ncbi:MAG: hypothetical protein HOW73_16900 [Polyangiaceae bacterium]|nr:hypothetical protein [Polyangiaceae bacterium]
MPRASTVAALALGAVVASFAQSSSANGAFPNAGQVLVDPTDPLRVWVNTSYGFVLSSDGGATFHLLCNEGIGYSSLFHAHAAVTPTGAMFLGVPDGLVVGRGDMCGFTHAPDLDGYFVVDVSVDPEGRAVAVGVPVDGGRARAFRSDDDLATWSQIGGQLPADFTPHTIDQAPGNPDVVYVSGLIDSEPDYGVVARTLNGGGQWASFDVPGSDTSDYTPFIAAVDPFDASRLYVRLGGAPGRLLVSQDAGATYDLALELPGFMYAFRLTPDGTSAYVGSDASGLHRLDTETFALEDLAPIQARCVTLDGDRVIACGNEAVDGFSVGVSTDGGSTFSSFLRLACIEGVLPCPAGSPIEATCTPEWPATEALLHAGGECELPSEGGAGGAGPATSSTGGGGAGQGGQSDSGAASSVGGAGASGSDDDGDGDDGCSCRVGADKAAPWPLIAAVFVFASRRRSRRPTPCR